MTAPLSAPGSSQNGAGRFFNTWFPKIVLMMVIVVPIIFIAREGLDICLDTPLSKFIPDSLTTALALITIAIAASPYLAGLDLGPMKIPKVGAELERILKVAGPFLIVIVILVLFVPLKFVILQDCNLLRNGSAERINADGSPFGWRPTSWQATREQGTTRALAGRLEVATDAVHYGKRSFKMSAKEPDALTWSQSVKLQPHSSYLLSAWIRTRDVILTKEPEQRYLRGANIAVQVTTPSPQFPTYSEPISGDTDWHEVFVQFDTGDATDFNVLLGLGGYSAITTGTVWFDDVKLEREN
jgi:hypothetical protein